ncbi:PAS domain-containing protein [Solitalea koreensis]|uniref:PAS domain S-box-containing protein n=1 Tax=Solitalea koreensis TaxID=543615 RepID=A0A521EHZ0_9SPHI|nr:PAS domain S-box protein [Solitalea koreensis]SMO83529.1 PAS domain S-box-containing protein [Solitalea koreensis]
MPQPFSPPKFQSAELNDKASVLFKVIWGYLLVITITFVIAMFRQPEFWPRYMSRVAINWLVCIALLYSMRKVSIRTIAICFIIYILAMFLISSWTGGGIKGHGIRFLAVAVLLSSLTVGRKEIWLFGILAALGGLVLVFAANAQLLPVTEPIGDSAMTYWIYLITNILLLCYIENLSVSRLSKALDTSVQELALRKQSEEKYRLIFESFQDIYYQTDMQGKVILVTPSVQQRLGYDPSEVIGKNVNEFYLEQNKNDFKRLLMKNGTFLNYELNLLSKDGTVINTLVSSQVLYENGGKPKAIEGTVHDITQRKRAEELLKLQNKELRDIAFLQLHIVRRPASNVQRLVNLLNMDDPADPLNIELIPQLETATNELDAIIREIVKKTDEIRPKVESGLAKD